MKTIQKGILVAVLLVLGTGCASLHRSTENVGGENVAGKLLGREKCWICGKRMRSLDALEKHVAGHEK